VNNTVDDYYEYFGIPRTASQQDIEDVWNWMSGDPEIRQKQGYDSLRTAYEVLSDPVRRVEYDRLLRAQEDQDRENNEPAASNEAKDTILGLNQLDGSRSNIPSDYHEFAHPGEFRNLYRELGVSPEITDAELEAFWNDESRVDPKDNWEFERLLNAYATLRDAERRKAYDAELAQHPEAQEVHQEREGSERMTLGAFVRRGLDRLRGKGRESDAKKTIEGSAAETQTGKIDKTSEEDKASAEVKEDVQTEADLDGLGLGGNAGSQPEGNPESDWWKGSNGPGTKPVADDYNESGKVIEPPVESSIEASSPTGYRATTEDKKDEAMAAAENEGMPVDLAPKPEGAGPEFGYLGGPESTGESSSSGAGETTPPIPPPGAESPALRSRIAKTLGAPFRRRTERRQAEDEKTKSRDEKDNEILSALRTNAENAAAIAERMQAENNLSAQENTIAEQERALDAREAELRIREEALARREADLDKMTEDADRLRAREVDEKRDREISAAREEAAWKREEQDANTRKGEERSTESRANRRQEERNLIKGGDPTLWTKLKHPLTTLDTTLNSPPIPEGYWLKKMEESGNFPGLERPKITDNETTVSNTNEIDDKELVGAGSENKG
jgi:hypothetical protein